MLSPETTCSLSFLALFCMINSPTPRILAYFIGKNIEVIKLYAILIGKHQAGMQKKRLSCQDESRIYKPVLR